MTSFPRGPLTRRRFVGFAATAPAILLGGCGSILPAPGQPPQLYLLPGSPRLPANLPTASRQLLIELPAASGGIDTERIALSRSPVTLDYFANAAWTDHAPALVQAALVDAFETSGKIAGVSRDVTTLRADYILLSDLRRFEAVYGEGSSAPTVRVQLIVRLVRMPERIIIGEEAAARMAVAEANSMPPIVAAFDHALNATLSDVVAWTLRRMAADAGPATRRRAS